MTRHEAVSYLLKKKEGDYHPSPDRMIHLMNALGNPQNSLRILHVAGTNGKGSVSCLCASVLQSAGYRTGLYTSPHLSDFAERISINGKYISDEAICTYAERVYEAENTLSLTLAAFDRITAVAFLHFFAEHCDVVVLEVGLGGLLDATNVIRESAASVITNIGLDHTAILGDTVEKIAVQKAGIIKPHCPVISYQQEGGVRRVIEYACERQKAPLVFANFSKIYVKSQSLTEQVFSYREHKELCLHLAGKYQLCNAATALEVLDVLKSRGFVITESAIHRGFENARWPGRFELLRSAPPFIIDGGHNPQCAEALSESLHTAFGEEKIVFLLSMLSDKDAEKVLEIIAPLCCGAVAVTIHDARALSSHKITEIMRKHGVHTLEAETFASAVILCDSIAHGDRCVLSVRFILSVKFVRCLKKTVAIIDGLSYTN